MEEQNKFYIESNGKKILANILINFELYGDNYCVYTVSQNNSQEYKVHCAKILGSTLIKIENEREKSMTNKIVQQLLQSIKE